MRAAIACALLFPASPACADGPALAHLTLAGTTITLTETSPLRPGGDMTFAQMHLGFPLPPELRIVMENGAVQDVILNGSARNGDGGISNGAGTVLGRETFLWVESASAVVAGNGEQVLIEAEVLSRTDLGQLITQPMRIEIQLRSP